MPTNAQQFGSDYYTTTANNMSDMFSQVGEEWDAMRADEVAYNEFLQNQINIYDQTIRQYGVIGDTQKHRATQNQWELVRAQQSENNAVATSQRRMTSSVGTILPDIRTNARESMSGEVGDSGDMSQIVASGADDDDTVGYIVQRINSNPTMGRFLSGHFISGVGGGGEASLGVRAAAGLGIAENIRRIRKSGNLNSISDAQVLQIAADTVGIEPQMIIDDGFMIQEQTVMTREAMEAVSEAPNHSDQLSIMEGLAPKWGLTPAMISTSGRMSEQETLRADAQTELDARLVEQQGQDRSAEIAATFRDRVGSMGSGAQYSDTVIGSLSRQRDLRRNGQRLERLQNATQSERILMGSVGQARQMALRGSNAQEAGGAAWDQASVLLGMARQPNGIANSDALVQLAADAAGGDVTVRDEILRNYLYLRQQGESAVALNTPEQQDRLLAERTDTPSTPDPVVAANQVAAFGPIKNTNETNGVTTVEHDDGTVVQTATNGTAMVIGTENTAHAAAVSTARTTTGARLTDNMSAMLPQLEALADEMGIARPVITSGVRTTTDQAEAMYDNWLTNGGTNGGKAYLVGLYADDEMARNVDDIFTESPNRSDAINNASAIVGTASSHRTGNAMDFRNRDNPDIEALLIEAKNRGMFTGTIAMESDHLHVEFDDVAPMDFSDEGQPLPRPMQSRSPIAGNQANAGAWNTLSPQQKEQSRASYNATLAQAWGTPNQDAIADNILGRMPPGSRIYYPPGSDSPVVISEYDLRTQGLPAGGVMARFQTTPGFNALGQRSGGGSSRVWPRGKPDDLMEVSDAATRAGAPGLAARNQAELLRLQGLLDNPVVPFTTYENIQTTPVTTARTIYENIPLVTLDQQAYNEAPNLSQSAYDLAVNQALLDATAMTSDTGDTSSP